MSSAFTRRQFVAAGLTLGGFFRLRSVAGELTATADSCILIFLNGGMSHIDTFDPKPNQPAEIRGEFATIRTSVPGMLFGEHLPKLAKQAHRLAIVRSVGFEGRLGNHSPGCHAMLTGVEPTGEAAVLAPPMRTDQPTMGSAVARLRPASAAIPPFAMVPDVLIENAFLTPGQFAGWLGGRYDAFCLKDDPNRPGFTAPSILARSADMPAARLDARRDLLAGLNAKRESELSPHYQRAFEMLRGGRAQAAFDLAAEQNAVRDRYGRDTFGQSALLARRLVEAGVRFVNVHWPNVGGGRNWDTHSDGFNRLRRSLLPPFDRAISALLDDLGDRGRLERTLVVVLTEFGRAPQIGKTFQNSGGPGGRDHWSNCFSIVMSGGGVRGGIIVGKSDARGSFPAERPFAPADIAATVYRALGIDPHTSLLDNEGRERRLCEGRPIVF